MGRELLDEISLEPKITYNQSFGPAFLFALGESCLRLVLSSTSLVFAPEFLVPSNLLDREMQVRHWLQEYADAVVVI